MDASTTFYAIGSLVVVFLVGFLGYYAYRLFRAREQVDESPSDRFAAAMRADRDATRGGSAGLATGVAGSATGMVDQAAPSSSAPDGLSSGAPPARVYESGPALREITDEAVFMKRGRDGEITFQLGEKPLMPLKFLLDARARKILTELAAQATADFGQHWGILASEDADGRLKVTRVL